MFDYVVFVDFEFLFDGYCDIIEVSYEIVDWYDCVVVVVCVIIECGEFCVGVGEGKFFYF